MRTMALVNFDDIEKRAEAAGKSIRDALDAAEIHRSTWDRWKAGTTTPQLAKIEKVIAVVERFESRAA